MKDMNKIIQEINNYYKCEVAIESFNRGIDTIFIDIPTVLTTSLSEESVNILSKSDNVIETLKDLFSTLKFFSSEDIMAKKKSFEPSSEISNRLNDDKFDIDTLKNNPSENRHIKLSKAIDILNTLFKKKYVINTKRGVIINVSGLASHAFSDDIVNELILIQNKQDAKNLINKLIRMPRFNSIELFLADDSYLNNDTSQSEVIIAYSSSNKGPSNSDEFKIFASMLDKINKWLKYDLYFNINGQLAYEIQVPLSKKQQKKQKRKFAIEEHVLSSRLTKSFKDISSDEESMAFLIRLYNIVSKIFIKNPSMIFREKIYTEEHGFLDDFGLLNVLRAMNNRFNSTQIFIADEILLGKSYVPNDDIILKMISIQKNNDLSQDSKNDSIFKIIQSLNIINDEEYKFFGCDKLVELENHLINEAQKKVEKYYNMLNDLTLKAIKSPNIYKDSLLLSIDYDTVMSLKRELLDNNIKTTVEYYKDIIEINNPLFQVVLSERDLSSGEDFIDKAIYANKNICKNIEAIYMLNNLKVFSILDFYKKLIKEESLTDIKNTIEELISEDKYDVKDVNSLEKALKKEDLFSRIRVNSEYLFFDDEKYDLRHFTNISFRDELENKIINIIKDINSKITSAFKKRWDKTLEAKRVAENLLNIKEYAIIAYLVGEERNKGATTYRSILLGKKSEYSDNIMYSALDFLKSNKIDSMIERLIEERVLDRETRKASFGRYTAIVKGIYYDNNIQNRFNPDGSFKGKVSILDDTNNTESNKKNNGDDKSTITDKDNTSLVKTQNTLSTLSFIKNLKNIELSAITPKDLKLLPLDIGDVVEFCSEICDNKRFYNKNWEIISKLAPPLSDEVMMFLRLKNINSGDSLKKIIELEEKKRCVQYGTL